MDFSPDDIPPGLSGFERIVPEYDSERLAVGAERTAARQMNQQSNVGGSELAGGSLATSEAGSGVTAKADVSGTETTANGRGQTNSEERAATVATLKDHGTAIEDIKALSSVSPTGQEVDSTSTKQKKRKRNSGDGEGNETSRGLGEPITHGSYFPMVPVGQPRRQRFHNTPKVPKPKKKKVKLVDELDASSAASSAGPGSGTGSGAQGGTNDSPAKPKPKRISKLKEVFTGNVGESPAVDLAASGSTISESQSPEKPIRKRKKVTFAPSQVSPEENGGDVVAVASGSRVTQGEPSVSTAEGESNGSTEAGSKTSSSQKRKRKQRAESSSDMQSGGIGPLEDPNKDTAPKAVSPRKRKGKEKAEESGVDQANTKRKTGRSRREVAEPTKVEDHGDDSDVKEIIDPLPNETWKVVPNELAPPAPDSAEKVDEEGHVYCPRIWTTTKPELYGAIPTLAPTKGTNGVYSTNCDVVTVILEDNAPGVLDIVPVKTQERDGTVFDLVMSRTLVSANKNGKKNIAHQVTLFEDTEDYTFSSNLQALPDAQNVPPRAIMSISEDATGSILPASEPAAANPESTSIIESRRQSSPLPSEYFNVLSPERISELEQSRAAFNEAAAETWDMGGLNELQERLRAKVQEHKRWFSGNVVEADQEPSSRYEEPPNPYIMDVDMTLPGPSTPRMTESTVSSHRHSPAKPKDSPNRSLSPTKPRDLPASPPKARDQPARNSSAANSKEIFAHRVPFANANDPPGREHSVGIVESASARVSTRSMAEPIKEESLEPISARLSRRRQRDRAPSPTISSRASRSLPKRRDRPENCICRPGWVHAKCPACGPKIRDISDVEFSSSGEDDETLSRSASVQGLPRLDVTSGNNEDATGSCYLASPLTPLSSVPSSPERESVEPFAADVFMLRSESPLESKRQSAMGDLGQVRTPLRIRKPTKGLDLKLGEEKTAEDLPRESKRQSEMGDSGQIRIPLRIQRPAKWLDLKQTAEGLPRESKRQSEMGDSGQIRIPLRIQRPAKRLDLTLGEEKTAEGLPSGRATRDKHRHREQSERRESSRAKGKDKDNVQSESASTHRKRRRSVNNSNSTQLGSSSKSTNDVLNNPNEESVSGAEDAAPSPTAKRPRRQCAETASGLIKTQVAIKKRRPRTKKVDLQEDPSGSKDGLDGGMGDTLDGATEGYYSGLPNLMPSYVDDEPAPPPRLRRKRSTRPRVQPSWSALDGSGERPFLLRGCDWSTGDSPIGGTDALFFVQQPGQERIGGDDDGGGVELMGFANMAEPTYAPDMFENVEEAASRESLEPFQDAEHDNGISMEPSEPEENISVPPIEEATGNHEITATETTVLEKQEVREPPTTSLTSLPLEVRAILDAYIQNAPVCIIIARDRATALFPLHRLSKEFAFAYMGYFDVIGIEERVVRPDGTDETTVQWKFRVQWGIGGESILKNQQNAISLPWWMDENGSSRSRASTEGTELNSQSNAKQNADRLVTPLLYLQAKEGHPNSRLKNVNQWDSHFSMVPHFMLAELTSCFSDDAFPSGWFCAECGRVNFQAAMRHRQCTSEACARSKNRPIECYARELDDIRGPHGSSPLSLPYNEYTKPAVKAISTTWKTGMKTLSYYFDGPAKKVFAKHVFTSNVPNLQTVATSLLGEIQTDVELTRAVGDSTSNPYFTRTYDLMESEVPGLVELVTAQGKIPECLSKVHRLFLSRMPYAEIAETVAKVSRFNLIGWITAGSKKTHEPFQVKESYVFILCLGCDAVITLTPVEDRLKVQKAPRKAKISKKIEEKPSGQNADLNDLISMPDEPDADIKVEAAAAESYLELATSDRKQKGQESLPSADSISASASQEFALPPPPPPTVRKVQLTMVHGDVAVLHGGDFDYSIKRTGPSILVLAL